MFTVPLFPGWRSVWREATAQVGQRADSCAEARIQIQPAPEPPGLLRSTASDVITFHELVSEKRNPPEAEQGELFWKLNRFFESFRILVPHCCWARWLLLEHALEDASVHSDFLLGAMTLRTMIEDVSLFAALDGCTAIIAKSSSGKKKLPYAQARQYAKLLDRRILPRVSQLRLDQRSPSPEINCLFPELYKKLNEFVHPSYVGHAALITPEDPDLGVLLLRAFGEVYGRFLDLSWVRNTPKKTVGSAMQCASLMRDAGAAWDELCDLTLPDIAASLQSVGYTALAEAVPVQQLRETATCYIERLETVKSPITDTQIMKRIEDDLGPLCNALVCEHAPHAYEEIWNFPVVHKMFGFAHDDWLIELSGCRRFARTLDALINVLPADGFPTTPPYESWIRFIGTAVELTLTLSQLKQNMLVRASVRMLNARNALAAALCARALIENHSAVYWVSQKLASCWRVVEESTSSQIDLKPALDDLERELSRFLAGTKNTAVVGRAWHKRWSDAAHTIPLLVSVKDAFPDDGERGNTTYDHLSQVVHGEALRGGDLLGGSASQIAIQLGRDAEILAQVADVHFNLRVAVPAMQVLGRMLRPSGPSIQADEPGLRQAVGEGRSPETLDPNDFTGTGSENDPVRFRRTLDHHESVALWCRAHGVIEELWEVWDTEDGLGTIVWTNQGKLFWFARTEGLWWERP